MKRFWLVLLSLGLIVAFSTTAMAVDVKFSGEAYVGGMYVSKVNLKDAAATGQTDDGPSTAFYYQRLRLGAELIVAPGLSLITRADIMERILGGDRSIPGVAAPDSNGTRAENENIAFDMMYIQYVSPVGLLQAGYIPFGTWGTVFGNSGPKGVPGISLYPKVGPMTFGLLIFKTSDQSYSAVSTATSRVDYSDADSDLYVGLAKYAGKNIEAGLLLYYTRNAKTRPVKNYVMDDYAAVPYFKATFGPVYLEGELAASTGKARKYDDGVGTDVDLQSLYGYLYGRVNLGPAYVGATFAYFSGDDPGDPTKSRMDPIFLGPEWSPALIMWNKDRAYNFGTLNGYNPGTAGTGGYYNNTGFGSSFQNAYFWQVQAGVKPIDKLDICASVSKSDADQDPIAGWDSKDMGWEFDITATYKITNNLSYMLGGAYLLTGDYFKGTNPNNEVRDDYLVINKLTLTF